SFRIISDDSIVELTGRRDRLGHVEAVRLLPSLTLRTVKDEPKDVEAEKKRNVVEHVQTIAARLLKSNQRSILVELDLPALGQIRSEGVAIKLVLKLQRVVGEEETGPRPRQGDEIESGGEHVAGRVLARPKRPEQHGCRIASRQREARVGQSMLVAVHVEIGLVVQEISCREGRVLKVTGRGAVDR